MGFLKDFFCGTTASTPRDRKSAILLAIKCVRTTALLYFGGAYTSFIADALMPSSTWADITSMGPGLETIDSIVGMSYKSTIGIFRDEAVAVAVFCPTVLTGTIDTTSSCGTIEDSTEQSSGGTIFIRDALPYSHIEKRAEKIFSQLHKEEQAVEQFPTIIANNHEMYDAFLPIYGSSIKTLKDNLQILEAALRNETNNGSE